MSHKGGLWKMAADRGTRDGDNRVEESTDITDGTHFPSKGMCRKNGMTHPCHCNGKPCKPGDIKRNKTPKETSRVNGVSPKTAQNFSIPTLRSRAPAHNNGSLRLEKTLPFHESPGKRRRSLRGIKQEWEDRHSLMGPVSDHSIESKSDSSCDHLIDTNSALCSQHNDICSNVRTTFLGPISPDISRSCTPPLSSSSTHSTSTSCGGSATSLLNSVNACSTATTGSGEVGGELMEVGDSQEGNIHNHTVSNHHSSSASSTTSSTSDEVSTGKLCNGATFNDRNSLYSLFPAAPNRTALFTASTSTNGCIRFAASGSSSKFARSSSSGSSSNGSSKPVSNSATCHWTNCASTVQAGDLMDHIRKAHVEPQFQKPATDSSESKKYVCLWTSCKVYNKPSSSQSWLQRHILSHSGDKPFQCIVDGCGLRFTSQGGLERHVNSHFNVCPPVKSCTSKGKDDTPSKLLKRKKQLRRRKSWLIKTEDFFDSRVMETLRHQLVVFSEHTTVDDASPNPTPNVTFHSSVIARRTECSGKVKVLLRWTPTDILPDSWVLESQLDEMKQQTVPLSSLPRDTVDSLHPSIYARHRYRKHRRK